ncbi:CubicO group peptidase (beta-lactamase class C family) [Aliiruegeria haliotis]|uniref:CubicO group peptidase (Beta-lactamase class C family) n=1 Tax=Aliiruegeria haliotis TaxID=1280846 RepID=A0A2T0REZ0_9RHOB|nr:serine hydrolase domain-containing protein [Aliiruegeria haliotis]PRY19766.1 CubicO group peptidase (beta-lactamase class C family) [Aliiruegeria haliotis]
MTKADKLKAAKAPSGVGRRQVLMGGVGMTAMGVLGGGAAGSLVPARAAAQSSDAASKVVIQPITERTTPISKAKEPLPFDVVQGIRERFSVPNWQSAGDDGVYVNMHFPSFNPTDVVMPSHPVRELERDIRPELPDMTFTMEDGSQSESLDNYVYGDNRTQAVMMAHKGKVVYEAFPGMNPWDYHIWMSASKTCVGTLGVILEREGLLDFDEPITKYAKELEGTAWDNVSVLNAMNMASGLDIEETTEAFSDPESWIEQYFGTLFSGEGTEWIDIMRAAEPLEGEQPGDRFRYSTAITQALVLALQHASNLKYADLFNDRIYSKIGAKQQYMVGLASDGTAVGGGLNMTTPEDMLRYAMIFTPSWNAVSTEQVITDDLLRRIQTLGDPAAYEGSTEQQYHAQWFGESGQRNCAQWDCVFADGAMFKHGNMHQGIYADPERDFCAMTFSTTPNERPDYTPGYLRAAAKLLAGS